MSFAVHRLVAEAFHGSPKDARLVVDHINGDSLDNRPENLRWVSQSQNLWNSSKHWGNSVRRGVNWHRRCKKWRAYITSGGKMTELGVFAKLEDAIAARVAAEAVYQPIERGAVA